MAQLDDSYLLLPQHPDRFEGSALFRVTGAEVQQALDTRGAVRPQPVPFDDAGVAGSVANFDGFEAIAICGTDVYLTVETRGRQSGGYLVRGTVGEAQADVKLDIATLTELEAPVNLHNHSFESVVCTDERVMVLFEANGRNINQTPEVLVFDRDLTFIGGETFPPLEYRLTDATSIDVQGRLWVINYHFSGDTAKLDPATDYWGGVPDQDVKQGVEWLVELAWTDGSGMMFTDREPVWLEKQDGERNWEGISRFGDRGFLLVTDSYPETLLGFVPVDVSSALRTP